jgi:hypothetical protein
MKTKLLFLLLFLALGQINFAQSITIDPPVTTVQIGQTLTVTFNYTYTPSDGYVYAGINRFDAAGNYISTVGGGDINPLTGGTGLVDSISFLIPPGTTQTADLPMGDYYNLIIELKDNVNFNYITGDFPTTQLNLTNATAGITDNLLDDVNVYWVNDRLLIDGLSEIDRYVLKVYSLTCQQVISLKDENSIILLLRQGVYIAQLTVVDKGVKTTKIIVD